MERYRSGLILFLGLLVASCDEPIPLVQTIEVKVPVLVPAEVPSELLEELPSIPRAVLPSHKDAAVCFDDAGVSRLTAFVDESRARLEAMRALSSTKDQ